MISFHQLTLSGLNSKHLEEIGDHSPIAIKSTEKYLRHPLHNQDPYVGILFHQFPQDFGIGG